LLFLMTIHSRLTRKNEVGAIDLNRPGGLGEPPLPV
jgi:hypothetical protein